ncbi:hypothetical protein CHO01_15780 [Cellulomonas hominis]|uniref:ABC-type proline/glycine betaine transport system substrate-binding protein n=1 Tax=Cellulomonas hominis TaxID=156981 RepID=A0A511FB61_9CELL|nr:hypothetical protein [Cellulomonas hominis]MBB5471539.1 ABC-type proline/glycine betaine transport system substrate-binding protein [Cellulomonas hominis]NKY07982.1 hypothetical protein [Cellulomonas hominis]GEL46462.1 hypothetical protein CHO01_15780 [Cellulomonas hominis]
MRTSLKALATAALALTLTLGASGAANAAGGITIDSGATGCCRIAV